MKFLVVSGTRSGRCTEILKPALQMRESRDVLEAAIGERGPVVALGGRQPADLAVQPVVVVVAGEALQRRLGVLKGAERLRGRAPRA